MKYIFIACTILLFACKNDGKKTESTAPTDATPQVQQTPTTPEPVVDKGPQEYFTAEGNGWELNLKSAMNGTFPLELLRNNGRDTIRTTLNRTMEGNAKPVGGKSSVNFTGVVEGTDKGEIIELGIVPGKCSTQNGDKTNFTCKISLGKRIMTGCGNYSED